VRSSESERGKHCGPPMYNACLFRHQKPSPNSPAFCKVLEALCLGPCEQCHGNMFTTTFAKTSSRVLVIAIDIYRLKDHNTLEDQDTCVSSAGPKQIHAECFAPWQYALCVDLGSVFLLGAAQHLKLAPGSPAFLLRTTPNYVVNAIWCSATINILCSAIIQMSHQIGQIDHNLPFCSFLLWP
jgi:hypothetical protein